MMGPLDIAGSFGHVGALIASLLVGFGFGFVLESSGLGDSRKLAGQFYFSEQTVLKVMFTAIVVAALLIGLASGVGLLDLDGIFVNSTHLSPAILGGLIMGVGFIIGGYCPGTSLVSLATGKIDGMFFVGGATFGIFLFGETVGSFREWWTNSGFLGTITLPELFGLSYGVVLFLVVLLALAFFGGAALMHDLLYKPKGTRDLKRAGLGAGALVGAAILAILIGQPTVDQKYEHMSAKYDKQLKERAVQIDPAELFGLMHNHLVRLHIIDVRREADWNVFHLRASEHVSADAILKMGKRLKTLPKNAVFVVVDNDESQVTRAWKRLIALGAVNVYILDGGLNKWLDVYGAVGVHGHHGVHGDHGGHEAHAAASAKPAVAKHEGATTPATAPTPAATPATAPAPAP
ncbi:MAG: YeeE/YedE family protein, partial [Deltaproteobacteria bacterium]|nr:YeeE/YedE family protein [Deltaproteobacteria bacterium]